MRSWKEMKRRAKWRRRTKYDNGPNERLLNNEFFENIPSEIVIIIFMS